MAWNSPARDRARARHRNTRSAVRPGPLRDEGGTVITYIALVAAALVGVVGLSVDIGRLATTNTQAKNAADAAAIAAATALAAAVREPGEIDNATIISRVEQAARNELENRQSFARAGDGFGGGVVIQSVRLLTSLPEQNGGTGDDPITATYVTTDPFQAQFVEVTTATLTQNNLFVPVTGATGTADTAATAVAGATQVVCRVPPLWICNPADDGSTASPVFDADDWIGHQALLKASGPNSAWAPGNFGLLDTPYGQQGTGAVAEMLASASPNTCFDAEGVDLRPGQATPVGNAINTRFDIYRNPFFGGGADRRNPAFRPARNVTKGKIGPGVCTTGGTDNPATRLPRDSDLSNTNRFGNGQWNCLTYWTNAHGDPTTAPPGCTNPSALSRYEVYRYEIDNAQLPSAPENGAPQCYQGASSDITDDPDRRVIYFAMINCNQNALNGNRDDVPVAAYGKAFLTEPVEDPSGDPAIIIEFVDVVRPGADDGVLHEIVQLYR